MIAVFRRYAAGSSGKKDLPSEAPDCSSKGESNFLLGHLFTRVGDQEDHLGWAQARTHGTFAQRVS